MRGRVRAERRRDDRQERRDVRRGAQTQAPPKRYKMRQRIVSFGKDFDIEDATGRRVYKVDGKMLRVRDTLFFRDMQGNELCKIQEKLLRVKDTMNVYGPSGETLAVVKKALITPVRERWTVKVAGGLDVEVQGSILDYEYNIGVGSNLIAEVSKKWFRIADTYGVTVKPGQNDVLVLAVAVVIDMMSHA